MNNNQQPTAIDMCFKYTELSKTVDKDIAYGLKKIEELEKQLKIAKEALEYVQEFNCECQPKLEDNEPCQTCISTKALSKLSI